MIWQAHGLRRERVFSRRPEPGHLLFLEFVMSEVLAAHSLLIGRPFVVAVAQLIFLRFFLILRAAIVGQAPLFVLGSQMPDEPRLLFLINCLKDRAMNSRSARMLLQETLPEFGNVRAIYLFELLTVVLAQTGLE